MFRAKLSLGIDSLSPEERGVKGKLFFFFFFF